MTVDTPALGPGVGDRPLPQYTVENIPALLAVIDDLKRINTDQQRIIADQRRAITALKDENAHLKARIAELEAQVNKNSRNNSRPPGGQKGHKGHTLKLVPNPDEIIVYKVSTCSQCGASLESVAPPAMDCRQVFDLPTLRLFVTECRVEHKWCPTANVSNRAEFPSEVTRARAGRP
jgi:hypothetical protein